MTTLGMRVIVVHGGGKAISRAMDAAGISPKFVQGRRYTDRATLEIVEKVLATQLNHELVSNIEELVAVQCHLIFSPRMSCLETLTLHDDKGVPIDLGRWCSN